MNDTHTIIYKATDQTPFEGATVIVEVPDTTWDDVLLTGRRVLQQIVGDSAYGLSWDLVATVPGEPANDRQHEQEDA